MKSWIYQQLQLRTIGLIMKRKQQQHQHQQMKRINKIVPITFFYPTILYCISIVLLVLYMIITLLYLTHSYTTTTTTVDEYNSKNIQQQQQQQSKHHHHPSAMFNMVKPNSSIVMNAITVHQQQQQQQHDDDDRKNSISNTNNNNNIVVQQLLEMGVSETYINQIQYKLPKWDDIVQQYGNKPIIYNIESCQYYKDTIVPHLRIIGAAGMFNTGTNLITQLLKQNCYIPERATIYGINASKELLGIRWQVPWGKHTPSHYKYKHTASIKASLISIQNVFPIITIRHPYRWIQSMCHHPYTAKWDHYNQCPNILRKNNNNNNTNNNSTTSSNLNPVTVTYGAGSETYMSIPHLWNDWYNQYYQHTIVQKKDTSLSSQSSSLHSTNNTQNTNTNTNNNTEYYPLLIVRMEDLIFHPKATITSICHCVGGKLYSDNNNNNDNTNFTYIVTSAKGDSPGHDTSTDIVHAYMKYGTPIQINAGLDIIDYNMTKYILDTNLMQIFHYQHPISSL